MGFSRDAGNGERNSYRNNFYLEAYGKKKTGVAGIKKELAEDLFGG
jgi:hypothetical protein